MAVPLRYTVYPATATLSVDAFHLRLTAPELVDVTASPVGVVGACVSVEDCASSKAPMSQPAPWGRATPRWSLLPVQPFKAAGIASTAALCSGSAMVCVGPPFDCSGPS